ncbi:MAG: hypothetical protein LVQ95_04560 [Candidatus Micrarchaeales archaeon]|nr:hypothetical protein [Candidatus Micrarchaeales archaeon]
MGKRKANPQKSSPSIEESLLRAGKSGNDVYEPERFKPEVSAHNEDGNRWMRGEEKLRSLFSDTAARMAFVMVGELQPVPEFISIGLAYELQLDEGTFIGALKELRGAGLAKSKKLTLECDYGAVSAQSDEIWLLTEEGQEYLARLFHTLDNDLAKERADINNSLRKLWKGSHAENLEQFKDCQLELKKEKSEQLLPYDIKVMILLMKSGQQLFQLTPSTLAQIQETAGREKRDVIESMVKLVNLGFIGFSKQVAKSLMDGKEVASVVFRCLPYCAERIATLAENKEARDALGRDGVVLDSSLVDLFVKSVRIADCGTTLAHQKIRQSSLRELADNTA